MLHAGAKRNAKMTDDDKTLPAITTPPAGEPPEDFSALARQYPGLLLAGGIAIGLVAGALLPRKAGGKLAGRAAALAAVAGELGLALSQSAREKAGDAAREGRAKLAELGDSEQARRVRSAGSDARSAGLRLARKAVEAAVSAARR